METPQDMTGDVVRLRRTWSKAASGGDVVGIIFYHRLFEIAPETRRLFPQDVSEQSRKLMQTLNWIIDHLDAPATLRPRAEALALRHVRYGVTPEQYDAVGRALIDTLGKGLGSEFTQEDAAAWGRVYTGLSRMMISAAYPASGQ